MINHTDIEAMGPPDSAPPSPSTVKVGDVATVMLSPYILSQGVIEVIHDNGWVKLESEAFFWPMVGK